MPTLADGDFILVKNKPRQIMPGLVYVVDHSDLGRIVKRLTEQRGERFTFSGDNHHMSVPDAVIAPVTALSAYGNSIPGPCRYLPRA